MQPASVRGFPTDRFTVLCAPGARARLCTQWQQLGREPHQHIGRPMQLYSGTPCANLVPLEQRTGCRAAERRPDAVG